jgi:hypothetical protein
MPRRGLLSFQGRLKAMNRKVDPETKRLGCMIQGTWVGRNFPQTYQESRAGLIYNPDNDKETDYLP